MFLGKKILDIRCGKGNLIKKTHAYKLHTSAVIMHSSPNDKFQFYISLIPDCVNVIFAFATFGALD